MLCVRLDALEFSRREASAGFSKKEEGHSKSSREDASAPREKSLSHGQSPDRTPRSKISGFSRPQAEAIQLPNLSEGKQGQNIGCQIQTGIPQNGMPVAEGQPD